MANLRTVTRLSVAASTPTAITFAEGDLTVASYEIDGHFIDTGGYIVPMSDSNYSAKTIGGFTLTVDTAGEFWATVVSSGVAADDSDLQANAIVTLSQVKQYLNLDAGNTDHDAFLKAWINFKSDTIESFCNSKIKLQSITGQILDGSGDSCLDVPFRPIVQVGTGASVAASDIQYRTDPSQSWQDLPIQDLDFILIDDQEPYYIELYNTVFPFGYRNIKLNYKAGYSTVPGLITAIVIEEVAMAFKQSYRSGDSLLGFSSKVTSAAAGSGSSSITDLMPIHKAMLENGGFVMYGGKNSNSAIVSLSR